MKIFLVFIFKFILSNGEQKFMISPEMVMNSLTKFGLVKDQNRGLVQTQIKELISKHERVLKPANYAGEQWMYLLSAPDLYDVLAFAASTGIFLIYDG